MDLYPEITRLFKANMFTPLSAMQIWCKLDEPCIDTVEQQLEQLVIAGKLLRYEHGLLDGKFYRWKY
jgi:hypothetical protein